MLMSMMSAPAASATRTPSLKGRGVAAGELHDMDVEPLAFGPQARLFRSERAHCSQATISETTSARAAALRRAAEGQIRDA